MKLKTFLLTAFLTTVLISKAQTTNSEGVSIAPNVTPPDPSAMLDVQASDKGLLIPRVELTGTTDVTTIVSPATSLLVYNTSTVSDVVPGYYYWETKWVPIGRGDEKMPKITFAQMLAMETNLTDDDRGLFVFVTNEQDVTFCSGVLTTTKNVYGVWYFYDTDSCYGKWIRLIDGLLSQPCPEDVQVCGNPPQF
ncbi:MAG: hypothetical protein CMD31_12955 [Flavobacteriales bacterium]|jgi:hypothetical protein|nr:hypothetical protein [Flavobacteriales bacterium]|tara:strand:+ start:13659 stop:14240 length:582 start_codon:yes stop_codon:yes gene_type:complete